MHGILSKSVSVLSYMWIIKQVNKIKKIDSDIEKMDESFTLNKWNIRFVEIANMCKPQMSRKIVKYL